MYILDKNLRNYKKLDTVLWFFQMLVGCKNCMEAIFQLSVKFCICTLTQDSNFEVSKHNSYLMEEDWSLHPPKEDLSHTLRKRTFIYPSGVVHCPCPK